VAVAFQNLEKYVQIFTKFDVQNIPSFYFPTVANTTWRSNQLSRWGSQQRSLICGKEIICDVGVPKGSRMWYFTVTLLWTVNIKGRMDVPAFIFGLLAFTVELMDLGMWNLSFGRIINEEIFAESLL